MIPNQDEGIDYEEIHCEDIDYKICADRIKHLRKCKKKPGKKPGTYKRFTQTDLADALSVESQTIKRYESGEYPISKKRLYEIAAFFGTTIDYLIGITDIPDPTAYHLETERVLNDAAEQEYEEREAARIRLENMFDLVGFTLIDRYGEPQYEFGVVPRYHIEAKDGRHTADIEEGEMQQWLRCIGAAVSVMCECKEVMKNDGNEEKGQ